VDTGLLRVSRRPAREACGRHGDLRTSLQNGQQHTTRPRSTHRRHATCRAVHQGGGIPVVLRGTDTLRFNIQ